MSVRNVPFKMAVTRGMNRSRSLLGAFFLFQVAAQASQGTQPWILSRLVPCLAVLHLAVPGQPAVIQFNSWPNKGMFYRQRFPLVHFATRFGELSHEQSEGRDEREEARLNSRVLDEVLWNPVFLVHTNVNVANKVWTKVGLDLIELRLTWEKWRIQVMLIYENFWRVFDDFE